MFDVGLGEVLFAVVMVVVLVALVLVVASLVRRGPDEPVVSEPEPITAEQLLAAEPKTVEERLAEIDALHAKGAITDAERDEARARIITTL